MDHELSLGAALLGAAVLVALWRARRPPPGGPPGPSLSTKRPPCRVIAGYQILRELGRGGMGVVYEARHLQTGSVAALKMILHAEHSDSDDRARFDDEAKAIALLRHPNIVRIHEVGDAGGLPFFSLEFCPGGTLADRLDGTPWPWRQAGELVLTLAGAMSHAHQRGIIHRDLKPANILFGKDGTPKITDFGLAKRLDGKVGNTPSGAVMGTPAYMAPEQANGGTKYAGPETDVHALGVILYELLTGRRLFKGNTIPEILFQVNACEPARVRDRRPEVPAELDNICLTCLQKDRAARYRDAGELAALLRGLLLPQPAPTGGPPTVAVG